MVASKRQTVQIKGLLYCRQQTTLSDLHWETFTVFTIYILKVSVGLGDRVGCK